MMNEVETKRNKLNLEIRSLLSVIDMIEGISKSYPDYKENTLNELQFLDQQLELVIDARERLVNIFKN